MYRQLGELAVENVDPRATAYNTICNVIKEYGQNQDWAQQNKPERVQLKDITFKPSRRWTQTVGCK
jgi:hypothetical protein